MPDAPPQVAANGSGSTPASPVQIASNGAAGAPASPVEVAAAAGGALAAASLLAQIPGGRNNVILTAVDAGVAGNQISLEVLAPVSAGSLGVVVVDGTWIRVTPAAAALPIAATGSLEVTGALAGDAVTLGSATITLVAGTPGALEAQVGGTDEETAENLRAAIGTAAGNVLVDEVVGTVLHLFAATPGSAGNALVLSETTGGERLSVSGPTLTGGESFPITTTAAQLKAALEASTPAAALVAVSFPAVNSDGSGSIGPGLIAVYPRTYLSGGSGDSPVPPQAAADGGASTPAAPVQVAANGGASSPAAPPAIV